MRNGYLKADVWAAKCLKDETCTGRIALSGGCHFKYKAGYGQAQ